ncbi:D-3-phosphoglycerate dehydrogenase [Pustulibacterium marinum]|uniref:D-3-phosphoglycerate dehydrogenase n=1 Tax=Pustulibacterium marinum TaxID=1224947 RepID=A0A1I7I7C8_9FLAO|nr:NAD(P)-dependent oxidoreductase [Pustulibacterium marinum]SFU68811.1 D-3-phosphoglycerate dehydrogenase [Pustulibacterium marinum]
MKILHLDTNHPLLLENLNALGFENHEDYLSPKLKVSQKINEYDGIIIRSRFSLDKAFLEKATNLKFIARVGAGVENIDSEYATEKGIKLIAAPEGNRNAVAEHSLGMLLNLLNNIKGANRKVRKGKWLREPFRGEELDGKTVGIIGYGYMGKAFAKKLRGFDVEVLCYDVKENVGDENATQVSLKELQEKADVVSINCNINPTSEGLVNAEFINGFAKPFYFLNTARGKIVVTEELVRALKIGKIKGAGLDVLEYEKTSFEGLYEDGVMPDALKYLTKSYDVIVTPHIAGWTHESNVKLAEVILDKIKADFC